MIQMHAPPPYSERRQRSHGVLVKFWISITRIVTRTDRSSANLVYEFFQGADFDSNSKDKSPSSTSSTSRLFVNGCDGDLPVRAKNTENDYDDDDNDSDDSENNCGDTFAIPSLTPVRVVSLVPNQNFKKIIAVLSFNPLVFCLTVSQLYTVLFWVFVVGQSISETLTVVVVVSIQQHLRVNRGRHARTTSTRQPTQCF